MKNLNNINANIKFGRHSGSDMVQNATAEKIEKLSKQGFEIIVGNNPFLNETEKYSEREVIRVSHVNSRYHGRCIRTIWAVK